MPREGFDLVDFVKPKFREVNKDKWMTKSPIKLQENEQTQFEQKDLYLGATNQIASPKQ